MAVKTKSHFPAGYSDITQAQPFQQVELNGSHITTCTVTFQHDIHSLTSSLSLMSGTSLWIPGKFFRGFTRKRAREFYMETQHG